MGTSSNQSKAGLRTRFSLAREEESLDSNFEGIESQVDTNTRKKKQRVPRKTIRLATKVKDPKTIDQKYKTIDGTILIYAPHTAWVQTEENNPLLRNNGFAFV